MRARRVPVWKRRGERDRRGREGRANIQRTVCSPQSNMSISVARAVLRDNEQKRARDRMSTILDLIGHTPLVEVTRFDTGPCRLFLKLESQNPSGSIKDRPARAMIEAAEYEGRLKPGGTRRGYRGQYRPWSGLCRRARAIAPSSSCPTRCRARKSCTRGRWARKSSSRVPMSARDIPIIIRISPPIGEDARRDLHQPVRKSR